MNRGPFSRALRASEERLAPERSRFGMSLLKKLLSTPQIAFPTLAPTFATVFAPGAGPAAAGAFGGTASRAAVAGDYIELYGTGMGSTNPVAPDGVVYNSDYPAASLAAFNATMGGKAATVSFAGLVGPGLFQLDVQILAGVPAGDQALVLTVSGIAGQPNLLVTLGS